MDRFTTPLHFIAAPHSHNFTAPALCCSLHHGSFSFHHDLTSRSHSASWYAPPCMRTTVVQVPAKAGKAKDYSKSGISSKAHGFNVTLSLADPHSGLETSRQRATARSAAPAPRQQLLKSTQAQIKEGRHGVRTERHSPRSSPEQKTCFKITPAVQAGMPGPERQRGDDL